MVVLSLTGCYTDHMMKPTGGNRPKFSGEYIVDTPVGPSSAVVAQDLADSIVRAQEGACSVGAGQVCHIEGVVTILPREALMNEALPPARVRVEAGCGCAAMQSIIESPATTPRNLVWAVGLFEDSHRPVYTKPQD